MFSRSARVLSFALTLAGLIGAGAGPVAASTLGPKLYFDACPRFGPDVEFSCYRDFGEVEQFLRDAAEAHPELASLESIGKSFQGRDLWVMTITDRSAGEPEDKPAIWVDGGIDADEVVAIETALGVVHRLLTDDSNEMADLLKRRAFYLAPAVIPDSSELQMRSVERPRDTTLRPWDDDGDGRLDEDGPEDLDGDQQALTMRKVNPNGAWTASDEDPRLMRRRRPDDQGPFYDQWLEGIDNDGDDEYQEDRLGGVDPNRNYPGNWDIGQRGNGPFAGSEIEIRAQMDFIEAHPNIAASQHLHSSGGVLLRPPSVPDWKLPASDEELYMRLSERGLEVTGYNLATTVYDWNWPRGSSNKKGSQVWRDKEGDIQGGPSRLDGYAAYGGSIDSLYKVFGVVSFANEIYQMGEDDDGDGRIEGHERLRWDDEELGGVVFKEWELFDHPQLGAIEIGGWRKFGANNPLAADLPEEVRRNVEFVLMQARNTPQLEIVALEVEPVGGHRITRVKATVANSGFAPTELAVRTSHGRAVPVRAAIELAGGAELLSSEAELELGTLAGHQEVELEWLVHQGPEGGTVRVKAWHPKGGKVTKSVGLDPMGDGNGGTR